jgi:hypothetical protein
MVDVRKMGEVVELTNYTTENTKITFDYEAIDMHGVPIRAEWVNTRFEVEIQGPDKTIRHTMTGKSVIEDEGVQKVTAEAETDLGPKKIHGLAYLAENDDDSDIKEFEPTEVIWRYAKQSGNDSDRAKFIENCKAEIDALSKLEIKIEKKKDTKRTTHWEQTDANQILIETPAVLQIDPKHRTIADLFKSWTNAKEAVLKMKLDKKTAEEIKTAKQKAAKIKDAYDRQSKPVENLTRSEQAVTKFLHTFEDKDTIRVRLSDETSYQCTVKTDSTSDGVLTITLFFESVPNSIQGAITLYDFPMANLVSHVTPHQTLDTPHLYAFWSTYGNEMLVDTATMLTRPRVRVIERTKSILIDETTGDDRQYFTLSDESVVETHNPFTLLVVCGHRITERDTLENLNGHLIKHWVDHRMWSVVESVGDDVPDEIVDLCERDKQSVNNTCYECRRYVDDADCLCDTCPRGFCSDCVPADLKKCQYCDEVTNKCFECGKKDEKEAFTSCEICKQELCSECVTKHDPELRIGRQWKKGEMVEGIVAAATARESCISLDAWNDANAMASKELIDFIQPCGTCGTIRVYE